MATLQMQLPGRAGSDMNWDSCKTDAKVFGLQANMGETYDLYQKIDAEMKTFPWNFPEKYSLPEFLPSPAIFADG